MPDIRLEDQALLSTPGPDGDTETYKSKGQVTYLLSTY
jgi:hypothetical protein